MRQRLKGILSFLILAVLSQGGGTAWAQTPPARAAATLADLGWLVGHWSGQMEGPRALVLEQHWAEPRGGVMMGMFRLTDPADGNRVLLLEFMSVREVPEGVELRFRHFDATLVPVEKEESIRMLLRESDGTRFVFENPVNNVPKRSILVRVGTDRYTGQSQIVRPTGETVFHNTVWERARGTLADERTRLVAHLERTWKALEDETKALSPEQWSFKAAPARWSVAEVYEHLAAAEDFLFGLITERVLKAPTAPGAKDAADLLTGDAYILKAIADRSNRVQAPEPLRPTNRFGSVEDSRKEFAARRRRTIEFVKTASQDLRAHFLDSPVMKQTDAFQWFLFISAHTMRHTEQIREVKADPAFPGAPAKER